MYCAGGKCCWITALPYSIRTERFISTWLRMKVAPPEDLWALNTLTRFDYKVLPCLSARIEERMVTCFGEQCLWWSYFKWREPWFRAHSIRPGPEVVCASPLVSVCPETAPSRPPAFLVFLRTVLVCTFKIKVVWGGSPLVSISECHSVGDWQPTELTLKVHFSAFTELRSGTTQ